MGSGTVVTPCESNHPRPNPRLVLPMGHQLFADAYGEGGGEDDVVSHGPLHTHTHTHLPKGVRCSPGGTKSGGRSGKMVLYVWTTVLGAINNFIRICIPSNASQWRAP